MKYVAYYRVSTKEQGDSGLGLEAQAKEVRRATKDGEIISEYTEVESGKRNDRPILIKAMEECKSTGATLVIAKLDRLSRNATFISTLLDSNVPFLCADMPTINPMVMRILGAVAQEERETISKRTKQALQSLKDRGVKLGKPENLGGDRATEAIRKYHKERKEKNAEHSKAKSMATLLRNSKMTLDQIAKKMNADGYTSPEGKELKPMHISRLLK